MRTRLLTSVLALAFFTACTHTSDIPVTDFSSFVRNLQDAGFEVKSDPTPRNALFPFPQSSLMVEEEPMQIYTFNTPEEATYGIKTISLDGTMVDHIAVDRENPVFYRKDAMIVVYEADKSTMNAYLESILGHTAYPKQVEASSASSESSSTASGGTMQP